MWRHARRQMASSMTRLVAAGLAIVLGTAFIAAAMLSSEVIEATSRNAVGAEVEGSSVVIRNSDVPTDTIVDKVADVPGVGTVHPQYAVPTMLTTGGQERYAEVRNAGPGTQVDDGALPGPDEVVISEQLASRLGVGIGDQVTLAGGDDGMEVTISGLMDFPSFSGRELAFTTTEVVQHLQDTMDWPEAAALVLVYSDQPADTLVTPIVEALGGTGQLTVQTADEYIDQQVADLVGTSRVLSLIGLAFAGLAIIVAGLVIANTFEVLVAQRTRTLAMLRCVGASTGQVRSSVLLEALVLGIVASLLGAVLGLGFGQATVWFLESRDLGVVLPRLADISPWALILPVIVGVVITLIAASGPARSATRVSPIAALRPTAVEPARGGSRVRLVVSLILMVGGALMLALAVVTVLTGEEDNAASMAGLLLALGMLGGVVSLVGVLVGAAFVVPTVIRGLGALLGALAGKRRRATVRLATANAIRNPRRSATTASALVIGVTLVVLMGTGAASARATLDRTLDSQFITDVIVENLDATALTPETERHLATTPGVAKTLPVGGGRATLAGAVPEDSDLRVMSFDPQQAEDVVHGANQWQNLRPGEALVPENLANYQQWSDGEVVELTAVDGSASTPVTIRVSDEVPWAVVLPETLAEVTPWTATQLWVDLTDGADLEEVVNRISEVVTQANPEAATFVYSPAMERVSFDRVIDALLAIVIGLLAVSVVIALVGVANTLSLSVLERRREHGVMRAVGVTRGQLRGMLSVEGVLLSLTGALIGVVLGLIYGWAGAAILLGYTVDFTLGAAPGITLGALAVGLVAGLIASVTPANSAIKVPPVVALSTE